MKPEDKENLEAAKEDIEQALEDYAGNYTEDEKAQLEEALQQIEDALEAVSYTHLDVYKRQAIPLPPRRASARRESIHLP